MPLFTGGDQRIHTPGVKFGARTTAQNPKRLLNRHRWSVGPVAGDRIEHISYCHDPPNQRDFIALKPFRVTLAIEPLMMLCQCLPRIPQQINIEQPILTQKVEPIGWMALHRPKFAIV
jgi:hypothetical protein